MDDKHKKPIVLTKSEDLANFFITVSDIIKKATSDHELIVEDKSVYKKEKSPDQILKFEFDHTTIIHRYLFDFARNPKQTEMRLTMEESDQLRKVVHAAYFALKETDKPIDNFFQKYYDKYFKSI